MSNLDHPDPETTPSFYRGSNRVVLKKTLLTGSAIAPLVLAFGLSFPSLAEDVDPSLISSYEAACDRVQDVLESETYQSAPKKQRYQLLHTALLDETKRPKAAELLELIGTVDPSKRYEVLQKEVQLQTGMAWECPSIEHVMQLDD